MVRLSEELEETGQMASHQPTPGPGSGDQQHTWALHMGATPPSFLSCQLMSTGLGGKTCGESTCWSGGVGQLGQERGN